MGIPRRVAVVVVCSALLTSGCSSDGEGDADGWRDPYCGLVEEFEVARVEAVKANDEADPKTIAEAIKPAASVRKVVTYLLAQAPVNSRTAWRVVERELLKLEESEPGAADRAAKEAEPWVGEATVDLFGDGPDRDAKHISFSTWVVVPLLHGFAEGAEDGFKEQVQEDCDIELKFTRLPE